MHRHLPGAIWPKPFPLKDVLVGTKVCMLTWISKLATGPGVTRMSTHTASWPRPGSAGCSSYLQERGLG